MNGEATVTATAIAAGNLTASARTSGITSGTTFSSLSAAAASLTMIANNVSVDYNQTIPQLTFIATGFVNGDTVAVLQGSPAESTTATKWSVAGTYPITITVGTLIDPNYAFTFVNGTLTVTSVGATATPMISVASGTHASVQKVAISDAIAVRLSTTPPTDRPQVLLLLIGSTGAGSPPETRLTGSLLGIHEVLPNTASAKVYTLDGNWRRDVSSVAVRHHLDKSTSNRILVSTINDPSTVGALEAFKDAGRLQDCAIVG